MRKVLGQNKVAMTCFFSYIVVGGLLQLILMQDPISQGMSLSMETMTQKLTVPFAESVIKKPLG